MCSDAVRVTASDGIVEIVLDRPKANAMDAATSRALGEAFVAFRDDPAQRVAIITGGGEKFFSAGWDLKAAASGAEEIETDTGPGGFAGLTELFDLDKPVIAAVNGYAAGGGFELALAADLIVAAEHAQFWLPEAQVGIIPDGGGVIRLPRRIPRALAVEMMFTGRRLSAAEGLALGLVSRVAKPADLMDTARALAADICRSAPLSLAAIKDIVRVTEGMTVQDAYARVRSKTIESYRRMLASDDAKEGPLAFAEKRAPVWKGR